MNGLLALTLRQMLGGRKVFLVAGLLLLPIALLVVVLYAGGFNGDAGGPNAYAIFLYVLYPQGLCVFASLVYGATLLAAEIEDKTLVYLFTRAQPRWKILVGKYLTTSLVLGVASSVSMSVCFLVAGSPFGQRLWTALFVTCVLACFTYTALFSLLGLAVPRRAITVGMIYAIALEFLLSFFPAVVNQMTASYYLRSLAYRIADLDLPPDLLLILGDASVVQSLCAVVLIPACAIVAGALVVHHKEWPLTEGV